MKIIKSVIEMTSYCNELRDKSRTAFIPTMGNLHQGHLALFEHGKAIADTVICSIYVNPTQFGINEDLATYPRTETADLTLLKKAGVSVVFCPDVEEMYPFGRTDFTKVSCGALDQMLCSITRPHFFTGVSTVVLKLLNIVQPHILVLGEKDFQQIAVIKRICSELFLPVNIETVPTVRDPSGLALSSRNQYLSPDEKKKAAILYKIISEAKKDIEAKPNKLQSPQYLSSIEEHAKIALVEHGFKIDYLDIIDQDTLLKSATSRNLVIAIACVLNTTRLIDNVKITLN